MNQIAKQMEIDKVINILYRIIIDTIVNQIIKRGGAFRCIMCSFCNTQLGLSISCKAFQNKHSGSIKKAIYMYVPYWLCFEKFDERFFSNKLDQKENELFRINLFIFQTSSVISQYLYRSFTTIFQTVAKQILLQNQNGTLWDLQRKRQYHPPVLQVGD